MKYSVKYSKSKRDINETRVKNEYLIASQKFETFFEIIRVVLRL